jgi:hypothetical protein
MTLQKRTEGQQLSSSAIFKPHILFDGKACVMFFLKASVPIKVKINTDSRKKRFQVANQLWRSQQTRARREKGKK